MHYTEESTKMTVQNDHNYALLASKDSSNIHHCHKCSYETKSSKAMFNHVNKHYSSDSFDCAQSCPEIYKCSGCKFKTQLMVMDHELGAANDYNLKCYNCPYCNCHTYSLLIYIKHVSQCLSVKRLYERDQCLFKTKYFESFSSHKILELHKSEHNYCREICDDKFFQCEHCSFKTDQVDLFNQHSCINVRLNKCNQCSYRSNCYKQFKKHKLIPHIRNKLQKIPQYSHGIEESVLKRILERNKILKTGKLPKQKLEKPPTQILKVLPDNPLHIQNQKLYECRGCSFQSNSQHMIQQHIFRNSKHLVLHQCKQCSYETTDIAMLQYHILRSHPTGETVRTYECKKCSFDTKQIYTLRCHMIASHPEMRCTKKQVIQKKVKKLRPLFIREEVIQKKVKKLRPLFIREDKPCINNNTIQLFKCEGCSFINKVKSVVDDHVFKEHTSHKNDRGFYCEYCPFKADKKILLDEHNFKQHLIPNK